MLTKAKALYQVKLILDYLPEEEYELIPQEEIDYVEDNFEYDENISIDPSIPLENQKIDDKAYEILDRIIKKAEANKKVNIQEVDEYIESVKESNKKFDIEMENIRLKNIIETLEKENSKIPKAKELLEEYKEMVKQKDREIEELRENNKYLYECNQKIPKFIRKLFVKDDIRLLRDVK